MATYFARSSGNVNGSIWATTPSGTASAQTFASGDVLVANSFTITLNVSTDLGSTGEIRNDAFSGATAGGSFTLSSGVTLTANVTTGSVPCATLTGTASATVIGNITGGAAIGAQGIQSSSTGTLTVIGSVTAGVGGSTAHGIATTSGTTINITGNLAGPAGGVAAALNLAGGGVVNITGNVSGSASGYGITINSTVLLTITGTVTGGSGQYGLGAFTGTPTITVVGTAVGGGVAAILNNTGGAVFVTRAKGGPLAASSVGVTQAGASGVTTVDEIEYGDLGASPTSGPIRLADKTSNVAVMYRFGTTKKTLVDANASGLMPAASNVRSGTVYNGGNSTGTCAVPAAGSVALGVPVDATTGTAALTPAAVWDYLTASATTAGSMGDRLRNAATVASTGQALADALTP